MKALLPTGEFNDAAVIDVIADVAGIDHRDIPAQIFPNSDLRSDLEIDVESRANIIVDRLRNVFPGLLLTPDSVCACTTVNELIGLIRDEVELG